MTMLGLEQDGETTFLDFGIWQALMATELQIMEHMYLTQVCVLEVQINN